MLRDKKNYPGYFTEHQQLIIRQMKAEIFFCPETLAFCTGLSKKQVNKHLKELLRLGIVCRMSFAQIIKEHYKHKNNADVCSSAITHAFAKRSALQHKTQRYYHIMIYNRLYFYYLSDYGKKQQEMMCAIPE